MKRIALMALLAASLASGQWLQGSFRVPDTFDFPQGEYRCLTYDPEAGVMYLGADDDDFILVFDEQMCRPLGRFNVGGPVGTMLRAPDRQVLFCALVESDQVIAFDRETHQLVATYDVGHEPRSFVYCAPESKLYVANWGDASLSVIDLKAGVVVATIQGIDLEYTYQGLCYVPSAHRLFCLGRSDTVVTVVDVASDTVVARIKVGEDQIAIAYNAANNRVYVACAYDQLYSIDAAALTVRTVPEGYVVSRSLACDTLRNRVYATDDGGLRVIDAAADTVMAMIAIEGYPQWVGFDGRNDKVYVFSECDHVGDNPNNVAVVDGGSLALVRRLPGPALPWATGQWGSDAVFCVGEDDREPIAVYDGGDVRLAGWLAEESRVTGLCADAAGGKLYCLSSSPPLVMAIDPATDRVLASVALTGNPGPVCANTIDRKVYVGNENDWGHGIVAVLDGVGDTLLSEIDLQGSPNLLAYNPDDNVVYVTGGSSSLVYVVDGKGDTVVGEFCANSWPDSLIYNSAQRKLYAIDNANAVVAIDSRTYIEVGRVPLPGGLDCYALDPSGSSLFGGNPWDDSIYVIDCVRDTLRCIIPVAGSPISLCYDSRHDRLYGLTNRDSGRLWVVDAHCDSMVATLPVAGRYLYYDSTTDAVYCLGQRSLTVVDGQTCTIVKSFAADFGPVGLASAAGWSHVYAARRDDRSYVSRIRKASGPAEMAVRATPVWQATVVRRSLDWTGTLAVMYDMGGRRAADVHRGGNDVSRLKPGVYFVRQNGVRPRTYARKVVVTR